MIKPSGLGVNVALFSRLMMSGWLASACDMKMKGFSLLLYFFFALFFFKFFNPFFLNQLV